MMWSYAATVFGIGRSPWAPGTVASAVALPFAWVVLKYLGPVALFALSFAVASIGTWACEVYIRATNETDPSECVIDEVAGQFVACALAPLSLYGFILAFALFRLFDISKLWPISEAEKLHGGLGIVADDMVAGVLAGLIVAVVASLGLI